MISDEKNIMANIESKGQKFVEKGSYVKRGTTIIKAEPFAVVLRPEFRSERCDACFERCKVSRCCGCQYVYYCGRNCQRKSWPVHKVECSSLKRLYPGVLPVDVHMMARIIIKLQHGGNQERGYYGSNEYRTFGDLMSHTCNISKDLMSLKRFEACCAELQDFLPPELLPKGNKLLTIYGRMAMNRFSIMNLEMVHIGLGIYLGPSIINHSCKPNVARVFYGTMLVLRAVRDIPSFDWTKVSICYIDVLNTVDARQELLRSYYFQCNCDGCKNPNPVETAAACRNKSCTNPCFSDDLECSKCGHKFPPDFKENFEKIKWRSLRYLDEKEDERLLEKVRACLAEQEGLLHPLNVLHVRILRMALTVATKLNFWEEAEIYLRKLLPKYKYYYGDSHPITSNAYLGLARILYTGKKLKQFFDIFDETLNIVKSAFGEDYPEVQKFILLGILVKHDMSIRFEQ